MGTDLVFSQEFRVVNDLFVPVLLGMTWLASTNPVIDWSTGTMEFATG